MEDAVKLSDVPTIVAPSMAVPEWLGDRLVNLFDRVECECPKHGHYFGRVRKGSQETPQCPLCASEEASRDKALDDLKDRLRRTHAALESMLKPYGLYRPRYGTLDAFNAKGEKAKDKQTALKAATRFSQRLLDRIQTGTHPELGLFFFGEVGTGKTHLATACLDELAKQGVPGLFLRVADLFDLLNSSAYGAARGDFSVTAFIGLVSRISCLVLDDVGVQSWSLSEQKRLQQILEGRQANGLPTIYTTNLGAPDLVRCLDQRLVSRIAGTTYPVHFGWSDWRKSKPMTLEEAFGGD